MIISEILGLEFDWLALTFEPAYRPYATTFLVNFFKRISTHVYSIKQERNNFLQLSVGQTID